MHVYSNTFLMIRLKLLLILASSALLGPADAAELSAPEDLEGPQEAELEGDLGQAAFNPPTHNNTV